MAVSTDLMAHIPELPFDYFFCPTLYAIYRKSTAGHCVCNYQVGTGFAKYFQLLMIFIFYSQDMTPYGFDDPLRRSRYNVMPPLGHKQQSLDRWVCDCIRGRPELSSFSQAYTILRWEVGVNGCGTLF